MTRLKKKSNHTGTKIQIGLSSSSVIFDLLRKHYAHPIRTLVQEYLSNARDSHRASKNTKDKIKITLPSKIKPTFKIKDYGTGLSPEQITSVFSQMGASTKRDDNTQTGGFGIGSKSAFAYRENFFVRSFFNNVESLYELTTAHSFEGDIELVYQGETTERNGVEIEIPVKKGDEQEFVNAAFRAVYFWKDEEKPIFTNGTDSAIYSDFTQKAWFEHNNIQAYSPNSFLKNTFAKERLIIVLDGIPYPIKNELKNTYSENMYSQHGFGSCSSEFAEMANKRNQHYWIVQANTGDFRTSISRESLDYSAQSVKKIDEMVSNVSKEIKSFLIKEISKPSVDIFTKVRKAIDFLPSQFITTIKNIEIEDADSSTVFTTNQDEWHVKFKGVKITLPTKGTSFSDNEFDLNELSLFNTSRNLIVFNDIGKPFYQIRDKFNTKNLNLLTNAIIISKPESGKISTFWKNLTNKKLSDYLD